MTLPAAAAAVLDIWFAGVSPGFVPEETSKRWFAKDDAFDQLLRERFSEDLERASRGELEDWKLSSDGALAYVVLCDQLSRNVFRGTPRSFALDAQALATTRAGLERDEQKTFGVARRLFYCMPLMHSELLDVHDLARAEFAAIVEAAREAEPSLVALAQNSADYEEKHRVIIERFGRYPHRNAILGRESSPEELEFLKQPGSSF